MSPKRAKKSAKRSGVRKATKKAAKRKPARKSMKKPPAKKPPAKKPAARKSAAKKSAAKKSAAKRPARRPALKVVARPAAAKKRPAKAPAKPGHKPFGGAIAGASAKDLALFDLVRARVEVQAAIQGMLAASAETPVDDGKWTPRQIVLHLHYWDREMLAYVEPAWRENRRPPHTKNDILSENESSQGELGHHDWETSRRLMQQSRESLLEALQSVPEEPAGMWSAEHALGWLIRILSHHDRHHAAVIKDARTRTGTPA